MKTDLRERLPIVFSTIILTVLTLFLALIGAF
jgi:hypothetical protein